MGLCGLLIGYSMDNAHSSICNSHFLNRNVEFWVGKDCLRKSASVFLRYDDVFVF